MRDTVERALAALAEERKVKQQLTGATTSIGKAYELVEAMAGRVRAHLEEVDALVRCGEPSAAPTGGLATAADAAVAAAPAARADPEAEADPEGGLDQLAL